MIVSGFKVYGVSLNGLDPIDTHSRRASGWGNLEIITVKGVTVFAGYLHDAAHRVELSQVPGVTIFDSHLAGRPLRSDHRAMLASLFANPRTRGPKAGPKSATESASEAALAALPASATSWDVVTHLIDALGIPPGTNFDPNA